MSFDRRYFCLLILISLVVAAGTFVPALAQSGEFKLDQAEIATLPESYVEGTVRFSGDAEHYAYVIQMSGSQRVVEDGQQHDTAFRQVGRLRFSPETNTLFYWALDQSGNKIALVANGEVFDTDAQGEGTLIFSDDGQQWVAVWGANERVTLLLNGEVLGQYKDTSWPVFSPDGEHLAYLANDNGTVKLFVDGVERHTYSKPEVEASESFMSAVNGPNMPPLYTVLYLTDGSLFVLSEDKTGWGVFLGEELLASYLSNLWGGGSNQIIRWEGFETAATIFPVTLTTAGEAPFVFWWERLEGEEEQWRVVKNAQPLNELVCSRAWDYQNVSLSLDGEHYGYPCMQGEQILAIIDGESVGPYDNIWGVTLSDGGEHYAYAANEGDAWRFYRDGVAYDLEYDSAYGPLLSSDGAHVLWKGIRGEDPNDKIFIGLDGQELAVDVDVLWGPVFDDAGDMVWMAQEEGKIIRYSVDLE